MVVLSTPTTVAVSAAAGGTEVLRVRGVPFRDALLEALREHLR
jgi:hypothetical protein